MCLASKDVSTIAIGLPKEEQLARQAMQAGCCSHSKRLYRESEWSMLKIEGN